ncbi:MAG: hypothetical protein FJ100_02125 [Deltaproteobacteria bacterium]|nr:hypothetical protein [Deltaproteobacteria bacterium]
MRPFALPFALAFASAAACTAAPAGTAAGVDATASDGGSVAKADASADSGPATDTVGDAPTTGDAAVGADAAQDPGSAPDAVAETAAADVKAEVAPPADAVAEAGTVDAPVGPDLAATDAPTADAAAPDAAPPPKVQCTGAEFAFPTFSKACGADSDCFVAQHQVNCCGSLIALGLATTDKAAFEAAEKICGDQYPPCGCAGQPTLAEDGYSAGVNPIAVKCASGKCMTYVIGGQMVCTSNGLQEPKPFKWCGSNADCAWIPRTVDCCGSQMATAVTKASLSTFSAAEAKCAAQAAICDCLAKPMVAEDGKPVVGGEPVVVCQSGACLAKSAK